MLWLKGIWAKNLFKTYQLGSAAGGGPTTGMPTNPESGEVNGTPLAP